MIKETDTYYLSKKEPNKSCLLALRTIILKQDNNISETKKCGMPCFCYKEKIFCYFRIDKETNKPYILMVEGKHLAHKELEVGNRTKMKIFRVNPNNDLPVEFIELLINNAIDLYKNDVIK